MLKCDYRKHIWMVQERDTRAEAQNKIDEGYPDAVQLEWKNSLIKPVSGARALWHIKRMEGKFRQVRIVKAA
jgi:hypothetical protein